MNFLEHFEQTGSVRQIQRCDWIQEYTYIINLKLIYYNLISFRNTIKFKELKTGLLH
jgi:hypothetical protein